MLAILQRLLLPVLLLLLPAAPSELPGFTPNDQWFKVRTRATAWSALPGEKALKGAGTETNYIRLTVYEPATPVDGTYPALQLLDCKVELWVHGETDWFRAQVINTQLEACDGTCYFLPDLELAVVPFKGGEFVASVTALVKVKRDKAGLIKSAVFQSLGGDIFDGVLYEEGRTLRGGVKITGKSLPEAKLPFSQEK